ncbi:hypothetical protein C8R46DRAFT_540503 [Mycena filopes]|nr:hypothetical protein C8R46DRAFT_540503 [Mycena filopes]
MLPSLRGLTFLFYIFSIFQYAASTVIVRPVAIQPRQTSPVTTFTGLGTVPGLGAPRLGGASAPSGIAVLPVPPPSLTETTGTFTVTTAVPVTIDGKVTLSNSLFTVTATTLAPVATTTSTSMQTIRTSNILATLQLVRIASGSISSLYLIVIALVLWILCARRRTWTKTTRAAKADTPAELESRLDGRESWAPYIDRADAVLSPSNTTSTTRQLYISNQVHRARQKVAELEAETSTLLRANSANSSGSASVRSASWTASDVGETVLRSPSLPGSPGVEDRETLAGAMQQIRELNDRIRELEEEEEEDGINRSGSGGLPGPWDCRTSRLQDTSSR